MDQSQFNGTVTGCIVKETSNPPPKYIKNCAPFKSTKILGFAFQLGNDHQGTRFQ